MQSNTISLKEQGEGGGASYSTLALNFYSIWFALHVVVNHRLTTNKCNVRFLGTFWKVLEFYNTAVETFLLTTSRCKVRI